MSRDAAHIADIERRLANLAKAPRCGARTRAGHACKQAAVSGRARCRMHGGGIGSGAPRGRRNGNFKHGLWTLEERGMRQAIRMRIRETRALIHDMKRILHCDRAAQVRPPSLVNDLPQAAKPALFPAETGLASAPEHLPIGRDGGRIAANPASPAAADHYPARRSSVSDGSTYDIRPDAWGRISIFDHPLRNEAVASHRCQSERKNG
jgi:hypothetical protein